MAQQLARHSDINLTMRVYTKLQMHELASAVQKLPMIATSSIAARATLNLNLGQRAVQTVA
jgi:hypothetical protein